MVRDDTQTKFPMPQRHQNAHTCVKWKKKPVVFAQQ